MGKIRYLIDKQGEITLPVTHERGVLDSNGVNLETKLAGKQDSDTAEVKSNKVVVISPEASDSQYPSAKAVRDLVIDSLNEGDSTALLELYYPLDSLTNEY